MAEKYYAPGSAGAMDSYNNGYSDALLVPAVRYNAVSSYPAFYESYWLAMGWNDAKAGKPRATDSPTWGTSSPPPPPSPRTTTAPPPPRPGTVYQPPPPPRPPGSPPPVVVSPPSTSPPVGPAGYVNNSGRLIQVFGPDGKIYSVPPGGYVYPGYYPVPWSDGYGGPSPPPRPWDGYPPYPRGYYPPDPWEPGLTFCGEWGCIKIRDPNRPRRP